MLQEEVQLVTFDVVCSFSVWFFCLIHSSQSNLERLEEILDCVMNVMAEEEVGEEKLRLLLSEKRSIGTESLTTEYVKKYVCQSNVRQSCSVFIRVRIVRSNH